MAIDFQAIKAVILDMDGVLWRGDEVLPGGEAFFAFCQQHDIAYAFATNNSTRTVEMYIEKLGGIGISARPEQIITSAVATADYIAREYPVDTPVYVIGGAGIRQALARKGFRENSEQPGLVVVGMDVEVTYEKLKVATLLIRDGAVFIGTNGDRTFPIPEGLAPGNGSILAAIQTATDVKPLVIGKPETAMYDVALRRLQAQAGQTLMVGDRLETDILGGQRASLQTALVLTGITTHEQAAKDTIQADGVFDTLAALHATWAAALDGS